MTKGWLLLAPFAAALTFAAQPAPGLDYVYGSWVSKKVVLSQGVAPYLEAVTAETRSALKWDLLAGGCSAAPPPWPASANVSPMPVGP